jgi:hypothetical protein
MPCLTVSPADADRLISLAESDPSTVFNISVANETIEVGGQRYHAAVSGGAREALTTGTWDATGALLDDFGRVQQVAQQLPYVSGF